MSALHANLSLDSRGRWHASTGGVSHTGHTIVEDSGLFTVISIITPGGLLCHRASQEQAGKDIGLEWAVFESRHVQQTSRERDAIWESLSLEQKLASLRLRNMLADRALRPLLKTGDRIRATKAECCAREATFTFSHWETGWIVSTGTNSIAPGSVYSINGKVFRV